ncbi:LysR family transcriptional regulator [Microseira wollei]|uniref:Transcriptional regulator, LysR family protein n=1 Tax=Microseira wollei NIES-4236 TaxID=2530354 RepID=A0AAV3X9W4_9CYAN|nr:LysR family transcriptional regulator [Microseira wollei]GET38958.1 putative transcriptional regulator, LysR family protein [Microseira wollei NIES-4236]
MELRHLRYFVVVAEQLSFSRAAGRLYISQPALSRQIKRLEDELGVVLFLRKSDGLKLTEAGKFFMEQAKDILHRSYVAVQSIKAYSINTDEPLVIGYIPTILQSFLGETLHKFSLAYPQVPIRFQEMPPSEQVLALRDGAIDIAFMGNPPDELGTAFRLGLCSGSINAAATQTKVYHHRVQSAVWAIHPMISCPVASVAFGEQRGWGSKGDGGAKGSWGSKGDGGAKGSWGRKGDGGAKGMGEQMGRGSKGELGEQRGEKTLFRTINYTQLISRGHDIRRRVCRQMRQASAC